VLPQAVAFATIAGLPPEYGLYAAMVPAIVAALWGSSWHLVSGPTTAISIVVFASISPLAEPGSPQFIGLVLTLTLLAGLIQLAMGLARLGMLVNFISHTVIIGFTAGAAILIAASQIKNFFGLDMPRGAHFHEVLMQFGSHVTDIQPWVMTVGAVTLASGILAKRYLPKLPYMIVAMVVGGVVAAILNARYGAEQTGIRTVGALVASFPPLSLPDFSFSAIQQTLFPATIIAILALTEAVAIARSVAAKSDQRIDSNQEFVGQGLSNIAGSFFSGYAGSGSFNRSGVNYASGAKTPLAAALSAVFLLLIVLLVAPLAAYLPVPSMAAILFIVAWSLIDFHHIGEIIKRHKRERIMLALTFVGTLVDLEKGIFLGILVSLLFYLYRTSQPSIRELVPLPPSATTRAASSCRPARCAGLPADDHAARGRLDLLRRGRARAAAFPQRRRGRSAEKHLLLTSRAIGIIDLAGAELLAKEASRRRKLGGGSLSGGGAAGPVRNAAPQRPGRRHRRGTDFPPQGRRPPGDLSAAGQRDLPQLQRIRAAPFPR
jgi:sulfate permease, SulP family